MDKIQYISQCLSTNDEILNFLVSLKPEDSFSIYTFNQTQGRGQYGNIWETFPHQNLAFSIGFLSQKINLPDNILNFHTANILREFIAKKTEKTPKVKWPNDIILLGKKISGMLIEKKKIEQKEFLIIGIGINILQKNFNNLPKAGSIFTQTHLEFNLMDWTKEMHNFLCERLFTPPSVEQIIENYNQHLFKINQISVFEIKGIRQNGIIQNADKNGFIWIDLENDGLKKFYHKEIELLY